MSEPKVSVILPTHNRPEFLTQAAASVIGQDFGDWELLVINDGGRDVADIAAGFGDARIRYFHREENRGKAACCNFGLDAARGRYIAYLDDDDLWYPNHLGLLVGALESFPARQAAYSDLYRTAFVPAGPDGGRLPVDKKILVSRDFNRDFLFRKNQVLHVSLMHTREAARRAGGYDEGLTALIDWNITRKLAMITDFTYVPQVTGEYYAPFEVTDRISHIQVTDPERFTAISRRVKADLPELPWPSTPSLTLIAPVSQWQRDWPGLILRWVDELSHPARILVVNNGAIPDEKEFRLALGEAGRLKNLEMVSTGGTLKYLDACRIGAEAAGTDLVMFVNREFDPSRVEGRIATLAGILEKGEARIVLLDRQKKPGASFNLLAGRKDFLGIGNLRKTRAVDLGHPVFQGFPEPFRPDRMLMEVDQAMGQKNWALARSRMAALRSLGRGRPTDASLMGRWVQILVELGEYGPAEEAAAALAQSGYLPDNLIRLGRVLQKGERFPEAVQAYGAGLDHLGLRPSVFDRPGFSGGVPAECAAFQALMGLGECLLGLGDLAQSERMFWAASKLNDSDPGPFLGYANILAKSGRPDRAREVLADVEAHGFGQGPEFDRVNNLVAAAGQTDALEDGRRGRNTGGPVL